MLMIDVVSTLNVRRCFNVVILTFASTLKVGRCFNVETLFNVEIPTLFPVLEQLSFSKDIKNFSYNIHKEPLHTNDIFFYYIEKSNHIKVFIFSLSN